MVKPLPSKQNTRVRFPSPAPAVAPQVRWLERLSRLHEAGPIRRRVPENCPGVGEIVSDGGRARNPIHQTALPPDRIFLKTTTLSLDGCRPCSRICWALFPR